MVSRYSRQTVLKEIGEEGQSLLLNSKVLIIGCGALGTNLANNLARTGIGELLILDRDIVELNNLQRQILFDEEDVGIPKVIAASRKLKKINSEIIIDTLVKDLNSNNIEEIIEGFDLVLDATDNIATRMLINDACVKMRIPWIYAGVLQTRGMVMNIVPQGPCFRCLLPEIPQPGSMLTCEIAGVINTIPSIIASIESTEAIKILLKKEYEKGLIVYDVWTHSFNTFEIERYDSCDCCVKENFKYLNLKDKEIITALCENAVQIIPPSDTVLQLEDIAKELGKSINNIQFSEYLLKFETENKSMTLFKDGRAIIKGTGDKGVAKAFYSRYISQ